MPDAGKPAGTSSDSGAAGSGSDSQRRKIGGKFDSVEAAVESLVTSGDKNYHEVREEIGAIKQLLERAMTPIGAQGNQDDQGYSRGRQADDSDEDSIDPTEFLATPAKVLKRREAKIIKAMEEKQAQRTAALVANAATVLRFQMKNPDLDEHETLVQGFLRETNPNDTLDKRLKDAGKRTRAYLAKLKGKGDDDDDDSAGRAPSKDEFVADGQGAGDTGKAGAKDDDQTPDDDLASFVSEQRAWKAKRFAAPQRERS